MCASMWTPFPHCAAEAAETGVFTEKTRGVCNVGPAESSVSSDVTHVVGVVVSDVTFPNTSSQTTWSVVLAGKTVFSHVARATPFGNVVLMLSVGALGGVPR